jgi:hypothetical protein
MVVPDTSYHSCHSDANDVVCLEMPIRPTPVATATKRVVEPECWICLSDEAKEVPPTEDGRGGTLEMPEQLCKCPRKVHPSCLRQWQLTKMGTTEETHCKFCSTELPSACDPAALTSLKRYIRLVQMLENFLLLLSFFFCVGPFLLLMVYFSDASHPCHSNYMCLGVAVSMTCSQILTIGLFLFCSWKVKPHLAAKWAGLGLPVEEETDVEYVSNEWQGLA